jgi:hypothetical protein
VYHRIEPGHLVARIEVRCAALCGDRTEATVAYSFVGLSETGNDAIGAMTGEDYAAKMARWAGWIGESFERQSGRQAG